MRSRPKEQIRAHYEIEREIAEKLRGSTPEERQTLYTSAYDELFTRLPDHPQLKPESKKQKDLAKHLLNLDGLINEDTVFVEIGPGDCALSFEVAKRAKKVVAVDVSTEITKHANAPANFKLILSDGFDIPLPPASVDVVYSDQLMEHLHPDDSLKQLRNIYQALKIGGVYFCITPNRLSGPHDVSRHFDDVATGLHLREYTVTELDKIFRESGFSKTRVFFRVSKTTVFLPVFPYRLIELLLGSLPHSLRKLLTHNKVASFLLGVKLIATK